METVPIGIGALGLLIYGIIGLTRFVLADKSVAESNHDQIQILLKRCDDLEKKVSQFENLYLEQRSLKHAVIAKLTKAQMAVQLVNEMRASCTCGALPEPLGKVLDHLEAAWAAEDTSGRSSGDGLV